MNHQQMDNYLENVKGILKQVKDEVKKLYFKQEELNRKEQDILTIIEDATEILKLLREQQQEPPTPIERKIQSLNKAKEIKHNSSVYSITELSDSRIATGDGAGYLTLFTVDYEKEQWTKIKEEKGHNGYIASLCELSGNRLVSSSGDKTLKVWNISNNTITHIKTLEGHNNYVNQVIPLTKDIIASGSYDRTIRVWNVNTYKEEVPPLKEDFLVCSLLKLKNKDEMVSGGYGESVSFWNTTTFKKEHSVECCNCWSLNGLVELANRCVAVSGGYSSTIDVIDTEKYQRIKQIECKDYIVGDGYYSSLHLLNNGSIIYSHGGCFCQISSTTYEVLFKDKMKDEFRGSAITSSSKGKYIIASNYNYGISIFRVDYI